MGSVPEPGTEPGSEAGEPASSACSVLLCCDALAHLDAVVADMAEHLAGGALPPGCVEGKGGTVEHMRRLAKASKAFYEAAPWRSLTDEDLIHVMSPRAPRGMRCLTVLGAGGETNRRSRILPLIHPWSRRAGVPNPWSGATVISRAGGVVDGLYGRNGPDGLWRNVVTRASGVVEPRQRRLKIAHGVSHGYSFVFD